MSKEAGRDGACRGVVWWRGIDEKQADHNTSGSRVLLGIIEIDARIPGKMGPDEWSSFGIACSVDHPGSIVRRVDFQSHRVF